MEDNLVSIITTCYNAKKYIKRTLNSALAQTYKNIELLVIDNGSTDGSADIINEFVKNDSRVKKLTIRKNDGGGASAWKLGISNANGRYVAFLDADDLWDSQKIEKQLNFMLKNGYDFSYTKYHWIDEEDNDLNNIVNIVPKLTFYDFIGNTCIGCSTVMIEINVLKRIEIPTHQKANWDFATWGLILQTGLTAYGLNEDLMRYRIVSTSMSRNKLKYAKSVWQIYTDIFNINLFLKIKSFCSYAMHATIRNKKLL